MNNSRQHKKFLGQKREQCFKYLSASVSTDKMVIIDTELMAIAASVITGFSIPTAASGMPKIL
ncbi:hypothetical protein [Nitrosomonas sp.]|uniref:hypothetical protein n=1 Tax=Nitrosomonas sp. TaxID=42353 RepID=UPI0037C6D62F